MRAHAFFHLLGAEKTPFYACRFHCCRANICDWIFFPPVDPQVRARASISHFFRYRAQTVVEWRAIHVFCLFAFYLLSAEATLYPFTCIAPIYPIFLLTSPACSMHNHEDDDPNACAKLQDRVSVLLELRFPLLTHSQCSWRCLLCTRSTFHSFVLALLLLLLRWLLLLMA